MRYMTAAAILTIALISQARAQTNSVPANDVALGSRAEMRELVEAMQATAKASRENVDYARVVPDLLYQILAKLDKIEASSIKSKQPLKPLRDPRPRSASLGARRLNPNHNQAYATEGLIINPFSGSPTTQAPPGFLEVAVV